VIAINYYHIWTGVTRTSRHRGVTHKHRALSSREGGDRSKAWGGADLRHRGDVLCELGARFGEVVEDFESVAQGAHNGLCHHDDGGSGFIERLDHLEEVRMSDPRQGLDLEGGGARLHTATDHKGSTKARTKNQFVRRRHTQKTAAALCFRAPLFESRRAAVPWHALCRRYSHFLYS